MSASPSVTLPWCMLTALLHQSLDGLNAAVPWPRSRRLELLPRLCETAPCTAAADPATHSASHLLMHVSIPLQNGRGVNGTATLVRALTANGTQLTNATTPLEGAGRAAYDC